MCKPENVVNEQKHWKLLVWAFKALQVRSLCELTILPFLSELLGNGEAIAELAKIMGPMRGPHCSGQTLHRNERSIPRKTKGSEGKTKAMKKKGRVLNKE